jgi:hypothetical protein
MERAFWSPSAESLEEFGQKRRGLGRDAAELVGGLTVELEV